MNISCSCILLFNEVLQQELLHRITYEMDVLHTHILLFNEMLQQTPAGDYAWDKDTIYSYSTLKQNVSAWTRLHTMTDGEHVVYSYIVYQIVASQILPTITQEMNMVDTHIQLFDEMLQHKLLQGIMYGMNVWCTCFHSRLLMLCCFLWCFQFNGDSWVNILLP